MLRLKCCPRCVGDVFLENGPDGGEWVCVQCGHSFTGPWTEGPVKEPHRVTAASSNGTWGLHACRFDEAADRDLDGVPLRREVADDRLPHAPTAERPGAAVAVLVGLSALRT